MTAGHHTGQDTNDNRSADRWEEVVSVFRRMCFLRRQGKLAASEQILKQKLPRIIAAWSDSCSRDPEAKKLQLDGMFQTEQRRVEDAYTLHELAALRLQEELIPALTRTLSQEMKRTVREQFALQTAQQAAAGPGMAPSGYRPRVAFDDIPAVIDLIVAEEQRNAILNNPLAA